MRKTRGADIKFQWTWHLIRENEEDYKNISALPDLIEAWDWVDTLMSGPKVMRQRPSATLGAVFESYLFEMTGCLDSGRI